ncbi:MAG TPA: hypothetical protein VLS90_02160 [Thermodesulfobacteriota bacterium]|nr:hypothetical protein [Thermodesulfobacteriota bacterium]
MEQYQPTGPVLKPRRRWVRTILVALVIFVSGAMIGGGLTVLIIAGGAKRYFQDPAVSADRITHRMKKQLDLTEDQVTQVHRIILERQQAFQSLRKQVQPQVKAQIEKTRRELSAVLTPEQARKWEKRFDRFRKFWMPKDRDNQPGE